MALVVKKPGSVRLEIGTTIGSTRARRLEVFKHLWRTWRYLLFWDTALSASLTTRTGCSRQYPDLSILLHLRTLLAIYRKEIYLKSPQLPQLPCMLDSLTPQSFLPDQFPIYVNPNPTPSPFNPLSLTSLLSLPPLPISLILLPSINPLSPRFCNPTTAL